MLPEDAETRGLSGIRPIKESLFFFYSSPTHTLCRYRPGTQRERLGKRVAKQPSARQDRQELLLHRLFENGRNIPKTAIFPASGACTHGDLEARGWIRVVGRTLHVVPIHERLAYFTERGRNRKVIKADLDQAHFLIGAAYPNSELKIEAELGNPNFRVKKSVDDILNWVAEMDNNSANRVAARTAAQLVSQWRARQDRPETRRQLSLFERLEMEQ